MTHVDSAVSTTGRLRRRRMAIPMLAMKTKKPMNPIELTPSITSDNGPRSPSQPAKTATTMPSHPIHRGTTVVLRIAIAYSGTATPHPSAFPT